MNEKERTAFETKLRDKIVYKEEERNKIVREGGIKDVLILIEIIKLASQSQNLKVLERGLNYYSLLQKIIEELRIKYEEINSSKEEIRSFENKILRKLSAPSIITMTEYIEKGPERSDNSLALVFEINPN